MKILRPVIFLLFSSSYCLAVFAGPEASPTFYSALSSPVAMQSPALQSPALQSPARPQHAQSLAQMGFVLDWRPLSKPGFLHRAKSPAHGSDHHSLLSSCDQESVRSARSEIGPSVQSESGIRMLRLHTMCDEQGLAMLTLIATPQRTPQHGIKRKTVKRLGNLIAGRSRYSYKINIQNPDSKNKRLIFRVKFPTKLDNPHELVKELEDIYTDSSVGENTVTGTKWSQQDCMGCAERALAGSTNFLYDFVLPRDSRLSHIRWFGHLGRHARVRGIFSGGITVHPNPGIPGLDPKQLVYGTYIQIAQEKYRRLGLGTAFLIKTMNFLKMWVQNPYLIARIKADNLASINFHKRFGMDEFILKEEVLADGTTAEFHYYYVRLSAAIDYEKKFAHLLTGKDIRCE